MPNLSIATYGISGRIIPVLFLYNFRLRGYNRFDKIRQESGFMDFKLDSINYLSDLLPFLTAVDRGHAPTEEELLQLSQITKLS